MESDAMDMAAGSRGTTATSRWNPTKEQISLLESLYKQGIRTPSAEQIQQITSTLKVYGHIEGKNVFYWFQNHKARQRQKQKQEAMTYMNRFLHNTPPVYPPNVLCGPYYLPQSDLGFCPQCPKVPLPGGFRRRASTDKTENPRICGAAGYDFSHQEENVKQPIGVDRNDGGSNQETLPLFPLQPTGSSFHGNAGLSLASSSSSETSNGVQDGHGNRPFFDFFSGSQGSCENDNSVLQWKY